MIKNPNYNWVTKHIYIYMKCSQDGTFLLSVQLEKRQRESPEVEKKQEFREGKWGHRR